ncbi:MAG: hypothetical protein WCP23_11430, partial [Planctomycetota bacterium]
RGLSWWLRDIDTRWCPRSLSAFMPEATVKTPRDTSHGQRYRLLNAMTNRAWVTTPFIAK